MNSLRFTSALAAASAVTALSASASNVCALSAGLAEADGQSGSWMLVFPAGTSHARDGRGPFITGGPAEMQAIIDRTKKRLGRTELMVDYDHQAHFMERIAGTAKAAGWVKELQARADGIWARIEWTGTAAAAIKAGEYRYLSPLFTSDAKGRVDELLNIALVNMPALDLEAVAARAQKETDMDKIIAALGLQSGASVDAILAALGQLTALRTATLAATGLKDDAKPEEAEAALTALSAKAGDRDAIVTALSLKPEAARDDIVAAVRKTGGEAETTITALRQELTDVTTKLNELTSATAKDKAIAFVDGAIKQGRVGVKALRDHYVARHMANAADVEKEVAALPILGPSNTLTVPPAPAGDGAVALSVEQKEAARLLGIPEKDYADTLKAEQENA